MRCSLPPAMGRSWNWRSCWCRAGPVLSATWWPIFQGCSFSSSSIEYYGVSYNSLSLILVFDIYKTIIINGDSFNVIKWQLASLFILLSGIVPPSQPGIPWNRGDCPLSSLFSFFFTETAPLAYTVTPALDDKKTFLANKLHNNIIEKPCYEDRRGWKDRGCILCYVMSS